MAYVSRELVGQIKKGIKENFSTKDGWRITIKKSSSLSSVRATIRKAPRKFHDALKKICNEEALETKEIFSSLSGYHINQDEYLKEIYFKLEEVLKTDSYFDKSDIMTDYFNCSHYIEIYVGEYGKPFMLEVA